MKKKYALRLSSRFWNESHWISFYIFHNHLNLFDGLRLGSLWITFFVGSAFLVCYRFNWINSVIFLQINDDDDDEGQELKWYCSHWRTKKTDTITWGGSKWFEKDWTVGYECIFLAHGRSHSVEFFNTNFSRYCRANSGRLSSIVIRLLENLTKW